MPCNTPYTVYQSRDRKTSRGKPAIEFHKSRGIPGTEMPIPCGQCSGCRLEKSRVWAMRLTQEQAMHPISQYITLTYKDEELPHHQSLYRPHLTEFWKRLRKTQKIRYYACGEYGDKTERPHYHAIVFNLKIRDLVLYKKENGFLLYKSKWLTKKWRYGEVIIGESVTFESCAYIARYVMKKWVAKTKYELKEHYTRIDKDTGLIRNLLPEFQTMSKKPGIGFSYYEKYKSDIYQSGTDGKLVIRGGTSCKPPTYYDYLFETESKEQLKILEKIKLNRRKKAQERAEDNTPARLKTKESIMRHRANKQLPRSRN